MLRSWLVCKSRWLGKLGALYLYSNLSAPKASLHINPRITRCLTCTLPFRYQRVFNPEKCCVYTPRSMGDRPRKRQDFAVAPDPRTRLYRFNNGNLRHQRINRFFPPAFFCRSFASWSKAPLWWYRGVVSATGKGSLGSGNIKVIYVLQIRENRSWSYPSLPVPENPAAGTLQNRSITLSSANPFSLSITNWFVRICQSLNSSPDLGGKAIMRYSIHSVQMRRHATLDCFDELLKIKKNFTKNIHTRSILILISPHWLKLLHYPLSICLR